MFGVETRAWSQTAPSFSVAAVTEPNRREWLWPGPAAPVVRVRTDARGPWLRLSPGDPRRGPGSLDRCYVRTERGTVHVEQRPVGVAAALIGVVVVGAWLAATLAAVDGLLTERPWLLAGVPVAFGIRSFVEVGRRLDERRLRQWFARLGPAGPPAAQRVSYGPPRYEVPAGDCVS